MSKILPANRIAAIIAVLTGLAAFVSGLAQALPGKWQSAALSIAGAITTLITVIHYMTGSQKYDALQSQERQAALYVSGSGITESVRSRTCPVTPSVSPAAAQLT